MKEKLITRGLTGFPQGIAIGFIISIIGSLTFGDGSFHAVSSELVNKVGSELNAVIIQTILCGIVGSGFAMSSVVWEVDAFSLAKQTAINFSVDCVIMFPVAYTLHWMPHTTAGVLGYIGIFVVLFITIWLILYFSWKHKIKRMNECIRKGMNIK